MIAAEPIFSGSSEHPMHLLCGDSWLAVASPFGDLQGTIITCV
jgi:hypothetical protein